MRITAIAAVIGLALSQQALAAPQLEEITIVGSIDEARALAGTGSVVDTQQIRIEAATDINQLLKTVPGIYVREEDGYGLRPNIGIRGATSERSGKITLLEDGVMIAPAPYSNPSAYYFPTTLRMSSVEVIKGALLLRYGPQTTGGVMNMVSTPIPESNHGAVQFAYGENNSIDLLANYGGRAGSFSYLIETAQRRSDGFKTIDRSDRDTGFEIQDYVIKLGWEGARQSLLFKAQYSEEESSETYLGLTDTDFSADADRRYGLTEIDQMDNDHQGFNLTYRFALADNARFSAVAYHNTFARDWFKLGGGGNYLNDANRGDAEAQAVLDGEQDAFGLGYKHNNRSYESTGLELNVDWELGDHALALGGRVHEDKMDRLQPTEYYDQIDGELVYAGRKAPTGSNNRLEKAEAISLWVVDNWQLSQAWNLNLALRYEDVDSWRKQYADAERQDLASERSNATREWLPGVAFTYDLTDRWQLLAGVHRGFAPLGGGAKESEDPETSVNYEAGVRFHDDWFVEAVAFYSDFDNKTENCSNASPCSNSQTSGSFITGSAIIQGMEFQLGTSWQAGAFSIPLDLTYTYTDAEISEDNNSEGFARGDSLAAVPENTFSLRLGLQHSSGWDNYAVAKYIDEMCVDIGCNNNSDRFERTEDLLVVDVISRYGFSPSTAVFLKVENLFNEQAIVSREPDGARPNKPLTAMIGVEMTF